MLWLKSKRKGKDKPYIFLCKSLISTPTVAQPYPQEVMIFTTLNKLYQRMLLHMFELSLLIISWGEDSKDFPSIFLNNSLNPSPLWPHLIPGHDFTTLNLLFLRMPPHMFQLSGLIVSLKFTQYISTRATDAFVQIWAFLAKLFLRRRYLKNSNTFLITPQMMLM